MGGMRTRVDAAPRLGTPRPVGHSPPPRRAHPMRPEPRSRPPSVPPPPEGWPRSECSPFRLCLRRSSSRSLVAARGWGAGLRRGRARPLATFPRADGRAGELRGWSRTALRGAGAGGEPPRGRASPVVRTRPRRRRRGGGRGWDRSRRGRAAGRLWAAGPHAARFLSLSTLLPSSPLPSLPSPPPSALPGRERPAAALRDAAQDREAPRGRRGTGRSGRPQGLAPLGCVCGGMSPGSRGRGDGGRKIGSALSLSLQTPRPRRRCGPVCVDLREGSRAGDQACWGVHGGGTGACYFLFPCFSRRMCTPTHPSLAVPAETRFFPRREVTGTGDSPPPNPAFAGHGLQPQRQRRSPAIPP